MRTTFFCFVHFWEVQFQLCSSFGNLSKIVGIMLWSCLWSHSIFWSSPKVIMIQRCDCPSFDLQQLRLGLSLPLWWMLCSCPILLVIMSTICSPPTLSVLVMWWRSVSRCIAKALCWMTSLTSYAMLQTMIYMHPSMKFCQQTLNWRSLWVLEYSLAFLCQSVCLLICSEHWKAALSLLSTSLVLLWSLQLSILSCGTDVIACVLRHVLCSWQQPNLSLHMASSSSDTHGIFMRRCQKTCDLLFMMSWHWMHAYVPRSRHL